MDELQAVGDPVLRDAVLFARAQARPITADDLAVAQAVHRNVARSRLERLVEAGLLVSEYERRTGKTGPGAGRTAKTYAVAPQLDSIEFPLRRYETLLGLMLDALPRKSRRQQLREIGIAFGEELARSARLRPAKTLTTGFERVCEAVRSLGFQASVTEVGEAGAVISTPTCPLRPLVAARPEAVEIDRGMWAGLTGKALDGAQIELVECETRHCFEHDSPCQVRISLTGRQPVGAKS
jgi:predicted ArsR family transcriptional regulator